MKIGAVYTWREVAWDKSQPIRSVYTVLEDGLDSHHEVAAELNLFNVGITILQRLQHILLPLAKGKGLEKC